MGMMIWTPLSGEDIWINLFAQKRYKMHTDTELVTSLSPQSFTGNQSNHTPLSGEDIWINPLTQKRYIVHIDGCDI